MIFFYNCSYSGEPAKAADNTQEIYKPHTYTTPCGLKNCRDDCFIDYTNATRTQITNAGTYCPCPKVICSMIG